MFVFEEGGKLEYPAKKPWDNDENQQQTHDASPVFRCETEPD